MSLWELIYFWGLVPAFFLNVLIGLLLLKRYGGPAELWEVGMTAGIAFIITPIWLWMYPAVLPAAIIWFIVLKMWKVIDR